MTACIVRQGLAAGNGPAFPVQVYVPPKAGKSLDPRGDLSLQKRRSECGRTIKRPAASTRGRAATLGPDGLGLALGSRREKADRKAV